MQNELQVMNHAPLTVEEVKAQVNRIQEIMRSVMQEGQHYGVVPGCGDKPSLLKPGAEKIMFTFRLVPDPLVEVIDLPHPTVAGHREYRVTVKLYAKDGTYLGGGVGSCSTMETKYRFRDGEGDATDKPVPKNYWDLRKADPNKALELLGGKGFKAVKTEAGVWMIAKKGEKVEFANPADYYNTCEKMAKKRALVDATLTVTAASDIFTQDIDEMLDTETIAPPLKPNIPQTRPRNDATMVQAADKYTGEPIRQEDNGQHEASDPPVKPATLDAPAPSPIKAFCEEQASKAAENEHAAEGYIGTHTPRLAGKTAPPGRFTLDTLDGELTLQYWDRPEGLGTPNHNYAKVTYRQSERAGKGGKVFTNNELLSLHWAAPKQ